jgi:hypothetical protein
MHDVGSAECLGRMLRARCAFDRVPVLLWGCWEGQMYNRQQRSHHADGIDLLPC